MESPTGPVFAVTAELLAIPTFWFGGPWVTSIILRNVNWADSTEPYVLALTFTFALLIAAPTLAFIIRITTDYLQPQVQTDSKDKGDGS